MAQPATNLPVNTSDRTPSQRPSLSVWAPFDSFRRELDRMFEDFNHALIRPSGRSLLDTAPSWAGAITAPAVDIVEKDNAYEITAELAGLDPKDVEVNFARDLLTIRGEKKEEKVEKQKEYHLSERRYGSFARSFRVPDGVDVDKIAATFEKGVLHVTLPKTVQAQSAEKKIGIIAK